MSAKAIHSLLSDNTDADLRVYPVFIPQRNEQTFPVLVYQQVSGGPIHSSNGGSTTQDELWQVTAIGTSYLSAHTLLEQCRIILDGYSGTAGGVTVQHILIEENSTRDVPMMGGDMEQLERFGRLMSLRIMYEATTPTP